MKIIIDEREHGLFEKCIFVLNTQSFITIELSKAVLPIGDILLRTNDGKDIILIERKSFSDLLASIKDGRYEEQSYRLSHSSGIPSHSIFYLLEGMFSQLRNPNMEKKLIYSAMTSLQFFKGFSVQRTSSIGETAEWIISMADKIERELSKGKIPYFLNESFLRTGSQHIELTNDIDNENTNETDTTNQMDTSMFESNSLTSSNYCTVVKKVKKDNVTPENIGEIILCQIPGISSVTAMAIMKQFTGFPHLMEELQKNPNCLDNMVCENSGKSRKISKSCLENIRKFLLK